MIVEIFIFLLYFFFHFYCLTHTFRRYLFILDFKQHIPEILHNLSVLSNPCEHWCIIRKFAGKNINFLHPVHCLVLNGNVRFANFSFKSWLFNLGYM